MKWLRVRKSGSICTQQMQRGTRMKFLVVLKFATSHKSSGVPVRLCAPRAIDQQLLSKSGRLGQLCLVPGGMDQNTATSCKGPS